MSHIKGITNISTGSNEFTIGQILSVLSGLVQALAVSITGKEADAASS